jgi:hypothetical protein
MQVLPGSRSAARHLPRIASVAELCVAWFVPLEAAAFIGLLRNLSAAKSRRQEAFSAF